MTRTYGGLGIGLSIAKALIEVQGGRIWASSPGLNQGATFTVSLPLN
jgi:signal transduction histidine kinase